MQLRRTDLTIGALVIAGLTSAGALGASVATQTTAVMGRVLDGVSGGPVVSATVTVTGTAADGKRVSLSTEAGADGTFSVTVPQNVVRLRASARSAGYREGFASNLGPGDMLAASLFLTVGDARNVVIRLWPTARLAGTVTDSRGRMIVGATVQLFASTETGLGLRWVKRSGRAVRTDDRGDYQVDDIPQGRYVLVVESSERPAQEPTRFFPDTPVAQEARPIDVEPGQVRRFDVRLASVQTRTVAGRVVGGRQSQGLSIDLYALGIEGEPLAFSRRTVRVDPESHFAFSGIPFGTYRVMVTEFPSAVDGAIYFGGDFVRTQMPVPRPPSTAWTALKDDTTWVGNLDVTVDAAGRVDDLTIQLNEAPRIGGRVKFDGEPPAPALLPTVPVIVRPADGFDIGPIPQPRLEEDATFLSAGLPSGQYVVNVLTELGSLTDWRAVSITADGRDILGLPLSLGRSTIDGVTITLSKRSAAISGSVVDSRGGIVSACRVVVFPADRSERLAYLAEPAPRRVMLLPVDHSGHFSGTVPPGTYRASAVGSVSPDWMTTKSLDALDRTATTVVARLGETASASLVVR